MDIISVTLIVTNIIVFAMFGWIMVELNGLHVQHLRIIRNQARQNDDAAPRLPIPFAEELRKRDELFFGKGTLFGHTQAELHEIVAAHHRQKDGDAK